MRYYLGVDGGGTKATYALANQMGEIISMLTTKGYSRNIESTQSIENQIFQGVNQCLSSGKIKLSDIDAICFGMPCYGENTEKDLELSDALHRRFARVSVCIVNDVEVGWAGSLAGSPGINIVSGTGSIAFGKDTSGKSARCGGWNEYFSDEGSCYWLGRKTMELFSKQADGRLPKSALYNIIRHEFFLQEDFEFIDIMEREYIPSRENVAKLQIYLEQAALNGDNSAKQAYNDAVSELCVIIEGVAKQLDFDGAIFPVSYCGGLFKAGELISTPLSENVKAIGGHLQPPYLEPYHGAVLYAFSNFAPQFLSTAIKTMKEK